MSTDRKPAMLDYKSAGVDVAAGDALVEWLKKDQRPTPHQNRIISGIGGFASLFRADFPKMKSPCLVSSTDGVGTKVKLAAQYKRWQGVGQDLVAMCVNDLACVGAEPLFFLDYYACSKLDLQAAQSFLSGVREACHQSGCALIGGETAEMPGVYHGDDFDCAGFVVGVVDQEEALGAHRVKAGDKLIAVKSSGFHSNGYSLLRKVFAEDMDSWIDQLMIPTLLYPQLVLKLKTKFAGDLHAVSHITGGGFDNILRVLPEHTGLQLEPYKVPSAFIEVKRRAQMTWESLFKTLNCGVGLVMIVSPPAAQEIQAATKALGFEAFALGEVTQAASKSWLMNWAKLEQLNEVKA